MKHIVRPIRSDEENRVAVERLTRLMELDPQEGTDEFDEMEMLAMVVEKYDQQHRRKWPLSPIEAVEFHMQQAGLVKKDLVPFFGSISRVSDVLTGKRALTVQMMRRLHEGLGIPAKSLLGVDSFDASDEPEYDLDRFPLAEMQERGMFGGIKLTLAELKQRSDELIPMFLNSFNVARNSAALLRAPLHQSGNRTMDEYGLLVWRARVFEKARQKRTRGEYKPDLITESWLREVAKLSAFDDGPKLAQEHLSRHGICLVFERHFNKTYLDGAAMLHEKTPIVGLTLRHDRVDNFWFALLHELVHVGWHLSEKVPFIADNLDDKARSGQVQEEEADTKAEEALIPSNLWDKSPVKKTHAMDDALALAEEAGVSPAIVAGRVRHMTGDWRLLASLIKNAGSVKRHFEDQLA